MVLVTVLSCSSDDATDQSIENDNQKAFESYTKMSSEIDVFDQLSANASNDIENSSRSNKENCTTVNLLVSYQDSPISGFEEYDFYSELVLDFEKEGCQSNDWKGKYEFYIAGLGSLRLRDSAVFKNVEYRNGYKFDGYRVSIQNEALSNETSQVFDVVIDGLLTEPDGTPFRYRTQRNFTFENRFTKQEIITLIESSSLENLENSNLIETTSIIGFPLVYSAACFNGLDFLRYPVEGSQDFTSNFGVNFNINYGNGACDQEVALTGEDGNVIVFDL